MQIFIIIIILLQFLGSSGIVEQIDCLSSELIKFTDYYATEQWNKIESSIGPFTEQLSSLSKKFDQVIVALQRSADISHESARAFWDNSNWVRRERRERRRIEGG